MSIQIKTYPQLFAALEKRIELALQKVAEKVEEIITQYVMDNLYQDYEPTNYLRTYDYINSLTVGKVKKNGNNYQVQIYFDADKIRPVWRDGEWNAHMSWDGKNDNDLLPLFIEEGVENSLYDRDGIYTMENTKKIIEDTRFHLSELSRILRQQGINAQWRR